jgi:hypothetical protein
VQKKTLSQEKIYGLRADVAQQPCSHSGKLGHNHFARGVKFYEERRLSVQARETNKKREPVHGAAGIKQHIAGAANLQSNGAAFAN